MFVDWTLARLEFLAPFKLLSWACEAISEVLLPVVLLSLLVCWEDCLEVGPFTIYRFMREFCAAVYYLEPCSAPFVVAAGG